MTFIMTSCSYRCFEEVTPFLKITWLPDIKQKQDLYARALWLSTKATRLLGMVDRWSNLVASGNGRVFQAPCGYYLLKRFSLAIFTL